ncbi:hypothetical protein [Agreia sp. Leaf210]|uniref:hypothetical protein n=1 Tax=Agreia sp. Leaf210 TaxID=1735682 RepID=UPI0006FC237E|nr:hypothetical protein [Agreia sp. Leaf210]KQM57416.1 hypothetical protein ASE64_14630 [Agreia sp. Leaf210]
MYLTELRGLIANTPSTDWLVVDGPLFHEATSVKPSNMTGHPIVDRPASRAVLVSDIDVALEWGLQARVGEHAKNAREWIRDAGFSTKAVLPIYVDVFFRGSLVDRVTAIWVDNLAALLPAPHLKPQDAVTDLGFTNVAAWRVGRWNHALCRLVDALEEGTSFDEHIAATGFVVEGP